MKLRIRLLLFGRFLRERGKRFTAFLRLPLPEGDESLQILDIKQVEKILRHGDGAVVLLARALKIAHQGASIAEAILRTNVAGINLQSGAVVLDRTLIFACFAQHFAERVLRIGGSRFDFGVALQRSDSFGGIRIARIQVQIAEAVEGRRGIRVHLQSGFQQSLCAVIILLKEEPFPGDIEDVLVARIALQQVVHAGDGGKKIVVLNVGHPADEKLFVGGCAGKKGFGLGQRGGVRHAAASGK